MARTVVASVTQSHIQDSMAQQNLLRTQARDRTEARRIRLVIGETRDIRFEVPMTSVLLIWSEIASAELNAGSLRITGHKVGETILITSDGTRRFTYLVEVIGRTQATTHKRPTSTESSSSGRGGSSGAYAMSYTTSFGARPAMLRQNLDFQRKLTQDRTLRFSSDLFKFMGQGDQNGVRATIPGFGLNRMSLEIDTPSVTLNILDSQMNLSPLSLNNYAMRGFHLISKPASQLRGIELFAGSARPSLSFFDKNQGRLVGVVSPVAQGQTWQVRAGVMIVSPQRDNRLGSGGTVWQVNGRYAPRNNIAVESEGAYANGGLSWRARLELKTEAFSVYGEILRLDRRSPLISIGAQAGGRETEAFAFQWQPTNRFRASLNYHHTVIAPPADAHRAPFSRSTGFASASYRINANSRLGFRFAQQQIATGASTGGPHFRLETRTATVSHEVRFNRNLANNFEVRLNSSRETRANADTERGINFAHQLRFSFRGGSVTSFVNYTRRTPSLAGLIVRNPQLLPPVLQRAFASDPVSFLQTNRDTLAVFLAGVELPDTRGIDAGVRFQSALSRINLGGEVRYSAGRILGSKQRNLIASVSMNMKLDSANSVHLDGWKSFNFDSAHSEPMLTIAYVHRFGAASGGGFQFAKLLGLDRGQIQGRVFYDLNGNGRDDESEPGVAGMQVQVDGGRRVLTDGSGRFRFRLNAGEYDVAINSDDLGVRLRATTPTELHVDLRGRQTENVAFGVSNFGSIKGRVFNDLLLEGEQTAGTSPGVPGVRLSLLPVGKAGASLTMTTDVNGAYQFSNLAPGSYELELEQSTLPANFRIPSRSSWPVIVEPLENVYLDIPQMAERAVSGIVFIDKDGNGKFEPEKDETIEGARVVSGEVEVTTGANGTYILRGLPAGRIEIRARTSWGIESSPVTIELQAPPVTLRGVNLVVKQ